MLEIAVILPRYPDGAYAFQRRDENAPTSPLQLGLFGGAMENEETPEEGARREFGEETSYKEEGRTFKHLISVYVPKGKGAYPDEVTGHVFETDIADEEFEVFEGTGSERFTLEELLARNDIAQTARFLLTEYLKEK